MVSWEFNLKSAPKIIELTNIFGLLSFVLEFLNVSTSIDWSIASGLIKIVPKSGNTKPYDPELATYPLFANDPAVPLDPETNWKYLEDPKNWLTLLSLESSVKWIVPPVPDKVKFKEPGNKLSLYWALSIDITQKWVAVKILVLVPKVKVAFSFSNIYS